MTYIIHTFIQRVYLNRTHEYTIGVQIFIDLNLGWNA